jgi:hypothetical protein
MTNPYRSQPSSAFWSRSVRNDLILDPVVRVSFKIQSGDKVATAGSCFAQHISRYLSSVGVSSYITEASHPLICRYDNYFQYGVYTARYGNVYSSRQLLQLIKRAYGTFSPSEAPWERAGVLYDPFRPGLPDGYISEVELSLDRGQHLNAVREMFENLDIFVFTLGLTEIWVSKLTGSVFPSCPGVIAGTYDEKVVEFINLGVDDVVKEMSEFIAILRTVNKSAKIILTVSPVPLVATATSDHVVTATTYSKSVLRVAASLISSRHENVDYFPSYEIITSPLAAGKYYEDDFRTIRAEGVAHVMSTFGQHYVSKLGNDELSLPSAQYSSDESLVNSVRSEMAVICEELYNDIRSN